jgi:hypothetical protein
METMRLERNGIVGIAGSSQEERRLSGAEDEQL